MVRAGQVFSPPRRPAVFDEDGHHSGIVPGGQQVLTIVRQFFNLMTARWAIRRSSAFRILRSGAKHLLDRHADAMEIWDGAGQCRRARLMRQAIGLAGDMDVEHTGGRARRRIWSTGALDNPSFRVH
jgi:hypothetical protein